MSNYYFAYHGPQNTATFDYEGGYGLSSLSKRDKINIGDKVFVIQKLKTIPFYEFCGLFEVRERYESKNNKYPFRLRLKDISKLSSFIRIDEKSLSSKLPNIDGGNKGWSNFKKHFCRQGASFATPLPDEITSILFALLEDDIDQLEDLSNAFNSNVEESLKIPSIQRAERLRKASTVAEKIFVKTIAYKRNPDVVAEVLIRACGKCEYCNRKAPFFRKRDGSPYLEVHHKIQLSHGGEDTVENAIALCPNCHREKHFG